MVVSQIEPQNVWFPFGFALQILKRLETAVWFVFFFPQGTLFSVLLWETTGIRRSFLWGGGGGGVPPF